MRKYDDDELVKCPACPAYMVPLKDYNVSRNDEGPTVNAELWEFLIWGWMIFVYNYVFDMFEFNGKKSKLGELKQKNLQEFPQSLVCPKCLHILKRK